MKAEFVASLDHLREMLAFVRLNAAKLNFDYPTLSAIELAIEEALVNIIKHGYAGQHGLITIDCSTTKDDKFKIVLTDQGIPCNPLEKQQPIDLNAPIELRPIGGYGVFLMLKIMDIVDYRHENNSNILTLIKATPQERKTNVSFL